MPANLQGLWNHDIAAPWNSDYHTNINLQMNYWPAEVANLSECHLPLVDYMYTLVDPGAKTAMVHYGARGWVVHHLSDVWGFTVPADGVWGVWPMGAAWLCLHYWEHYRFGLDATFLRDRAYPALKEAATFCLHFLVEAADHALPELDAEPPVEHARVFPVGRAGKPRPYPTSQARGSGRAGTLQRGQRVQQA